MQPAPWRHLSETAAIRVVAQSFLRMTCTKLGLRCLRSSVCEVTYTQDSLTNPSFRSSFTCLSNNADPSSCLYNVKLAILLCQ